MRWSEWATEALSNACYMCRSLWSVGNHLPNFLILIVSDEAVSTIVGGQAEMPTRRSVAQSHACNDGVYCS